MISPLPKVYKLRWPIAIGSLTEPVVWVKILTPSDERSEESSYSPACKMNNSPNKWFVYILQCLDGSLYVGATNDPDRRLHEHKTGKGSKYVRSKGADKIIHLEEYNDKYQAFDREREIKGFSRQKKLKLLE